MSSDTVKSERILDANFGTGFLFFEMAEGNMSSNILVEGNLAEFWLTILVFLFCSLGTSFANGEARLLPVLDEGLATLGELDEGGVVILGAGGIFIGTSIAN